MCVTKNRAILIEERRGWSDVLRIEDAKNPLFGR